MQKACNIQLFVKKNFISLIFPGFSGLPFPEYRNIIKEGRYYP